MIRANQTFKFFCKHSCVSFSIYVFQYIYLLEFLSMNYNGSHMQSRNSLFYLLKNIGFKDLNVFWKKSRFRNLKFFLNSWYNLKLRVLFLVNYPSDSISISTYFMLKEKTLWFVIRFLSKQKFMAVIFRFWSIDE